MLQHGRVLTPHRCPVSDCRQIASLPRRSVHHRKPLRIAAQAASTTARQKETTETAQKQPTSSGDTTHVSIKTGAPTDPDHKANGNQAAGQDLEVDTVLSQELRENGTVASVQRHVDLLTLPVFRDTHDFSEVMVLIVIALLVAGFRSTRRTKIICTIGPKSCSTQMLATLAAGGMNCARLNMSHGDHEWHRTVIERIRQLNKDKG